MLWGVGLGFGDLELVIVKVVWVIGEVDVVVYYSVLYGYSIVCGIVELYLWFG